MSNHSVNSSQEDLVDEFLEQEQDLEASIEVRIHSGKVFKALIDGLFKIFPQKITIYFGPQGLQFGEKVSLSETLNSFYFQIKARSLLYYYFQPTNKQADVRPIGYTFNSTSLKEVLSKTSNANEVQIEHQADDDYFHFQIGETGEKGVSNLRVERCRTIFDQSFKLESSNLRVTPNKLYSMSTVLAPGKSKKGPSIIIQEMSDHSLNITGTGDKSNTSYNCQTKLKVNGQKKVVNQGEISNLILKLLGGLKIICPQGLANFKFINKGCLQISFPIGNIGNFGLQIMSN